MANEKKPENGKITSIMIHTEGKELEITANDIQHYLCPAASMPEVGLFLKTCQSLNLNPFAGDAFLIKYGTEKASIVIALTAYLKAAEGSKEYDGHEAGIILKDSKGNTEQREGEFLLSEDFGILVGGWAKVYRSDRKKPFFVAVSLVAQRKYTSSGQPTKFWKDESCAGMIRKSALKKAIREAFPGRMANISTKDETEGAIEGEFEEVTKEAGQETGELPVAFMENGDPDWSLFWTKVTTELKISADEAHKILKVKSAKELIDKGMTMEEMFETLRATVAKREELMEESIAEAEKPPADEGITVEDPDEAAAKEEAATQKEFDNLGKEEEPPPKIKLPKTFPVLEKMCLDEWGMKPPEILEKLEVNKFSEIELTPQACYSRISEIMNKGQ